MTAARCARLATLAALLMLAPALPAQLAPSTDAPRAVHVFLDCVVACDEDFLRTEIAYVNWVRERAVADVHVLVTTQPTGGRGTEYTVAFLGRRAFAGVGDTLRAVVPATGTQDDARIALARTISFGLVPYLARTAAASRLSVTVAAPEGDAAQARPARDPWNYWSFRVGGNTNFSGERNFEQQSYFMAVSANRTTEAWKLAVHLNSSQHSSRFVFEDAASGARDAFTSFNRSANLNGLVVRSLGSHWSAGLRGSLSSSTYHNQQLAARLLPALEFNVFPYAQSTRRQLRLQYGIGAQALDYVETTIFGRLAETKPTHEGSMTLDLRQPWGASYLSLDAQQYLDEPRHYRWSLYANTSVRVFRGLSLNFYGGYERLRNQIYLPARGASRDEILTRQRQLETGFNYHGGVGLSYTFGSIYNNVVNPRFGGDGGAAFFD